MDFEKLIPIIDQTREEVIGYRRKIHENPELSFEEVETSTLVKERLEAWGIPWKSLAKTGLVGEIQGGLPGPTLALRADMDALPIQEETDLPFASKNPGVMHACGHDAHTANLLGVAKVLNQVKDQLPGRVKLIFQPAEEAGGGGREVVKSGVLDDVDLALAFHVWVAPEGQIRIQEGNITAYSDAISLDIYGKASHSSRPKEGVDALFISSKVLDNLYSLKDRLFNPQDQYTLSLGKIHGGQAINILPDHIHIDGMIRSMDPKVRQDLREMMEKIVQEIPQLYGGRGDFVFKEGYPSVYNDPSLQKIALDYLKNNYKSIVKDLNLGINPMYTQDYLIDNHRVELGSEDFGFYSQKVPSLFLWIGTGLGPQAHNNQFMINEDCLAYMTRLMVSLSIELLKTHKEERDEEK